ncbi:MAG: N-acetylmuramoyl-L-alanine amidase [Ruminococcus sp.]|jgi:N-acetylmuramoyl-L-alanine amidase
MKKRMLKKGILLFVILCLLSANFVWASPAAIAETEEAAETETELEKEEQAGPEESEIPKEDISDDIEQQEDTDSSLPEEEKEEQELEEETENGLTDESQPESSLPEENEEDSQLLPKSGQTAVKAAAGWEETEDGLKYRDGNGDYLKNTTEKIGKYRFMFDEQGYVKTGWQEIDGQTYYLKQTGEPGIKGAMFLGWQNINSQTYYFKQTGAKAGVMFKGFQSIGGRKFYFNPAGEAGEKGRMLLGWQEVDGRTYYLKKTGEKGVKGKALLGWQSINSQTYYFKQTGTKAGVMLEGLQSIGGRKFYFNPTGEAGEKGRMLLGWQEVNGRTYYLKKTGETGVKGKALLGWQSIGGKTYYFLKSGSQQGKMLTGFQSIGGRKFYFKRTGEDGIKGQMFLGWQSIGGDKYYFKQTGANGLKGAMFIGWQSINNKQYYFDPNGVYIPGKKKITVAIDAGHQLHGNSSLEPIGPGASEKKAKVSSGTYGQWSGLNEYELNLTVAKKLQKELENRGYEVYMIRTTHNVDISNSQRAKNAANAGADILIRIHANSDSNSSVSGALTIAPTNSNPYMTKTNISKSRQLSQKVLDAFCKATGAKKRSIWYTDTMSGINWSTIPVTIVEMGFMSNRQDDLNMANDSYQNKMVQGMADGIDDYF